MTYTANFRRPELVLAVDFQSWGFCLDLFDWSFGRTIDPDLHVYTFGPFNVVFYPE